MKKITCLILIISLFLPTTLSVNANNDVLPHIIVNDDFGYEYSEYIDEDNRIIRTYTKEKQSRTYNNIARNSINDGSMDQEKTKSLLKDLGMNDSFISQISDEQLLDYSRCESLTGIISYIKSDYQGNSTYVTEEEATLYSKPNIDQDIIDDPTGYPSEITSSTDENGYIRIFYMITYYGNALYKHSIDAEWLKMPKYRLQDSLGAITMDMTVNDESRNGWYSYSTWEYINYGYSSHYDEYDTYEEFDESSFSNAMNSSWYGSAVIFDLPDDLVLPPNESGTQQVIHEHYIYHSKFQVHYEYEGHIRTPEEIHYFNSVATYCHSWNIFVLEPSISVSYPASVGISIGLSLQINYDNFYAKFPTDLKYEP